MGSEDFSYLGLFRSALRKLPSSKEALGKMILTLSGLGLAIPFLMYFGDLSPSVPKLLLAPISAMGVVILVSFGTWFRKYLNDREIVGSVEARREAIKEVTRTIIVKNGSLYSLLDPTRFVSLPVKETVSLENF